MSELLPPHIRRAILDRHICDLCGDPVLGDDDGRERHVICELMGPPDAIEGHVIEPDLDRLPRAMIESTTEFDYTDLPDDLRDGLRDWCQRFARWAGSP